MIQLAQHIGFPLQSNISIRTFRYQSELRIKSDHDVGELGRVNLVDIHLLDSNNLIGLHVYSSVDNAKHSFANFFLESLQNRKSSV